VVAVCNGNAGTLEIEIYENKLLNELYIYENPIKFLIATDERVVISFDVAIDKLKDTNIYVKEISIRPKDNKVLEEIGKKYEKRQDKSAMLYFKAIVKNTTDEIKFPNENNEFINNDGDVRFKLKYCACCLLKLDATGYLDNSLKNISKNEVASCNKTPMSAKVAIIVLHRTAGGAASGTITHMTNEGYGAHFVVDFDGKVYHTISLNNQGSHIGRAQFEATVKAGWGNSNSIGIETCGYSYDKDGNKRVGLAGDKVKHHHWDAVTDEQAKSVACVVNFLLSYFNLNIADVKNHEDLCSKDPEEGKTVYNAMSKYL
jgi:hypothetical protein